MTKSPKPRKTEAYYSVSLERGLSVLRCFTPDRPNWTLSQISSAIELNKTSTYRYVNTLVELGYLKRDPQTKAIRLGPQIMTFSLGYFYSNNLLETARPLIDDVSETYNITTELAFYEEEMATILYRRDASEAFVPRFPISRKREQFYLSAIGKAILSNRSKIEIDASLANVELIPKTDNTITDKDAFAEELKLTRKRGYALNNEEWVTGLIAIAAPVMDNFAGKAIGAVCFDFSTINNSISKIEDKYANLAIKLAGNISRLVELHGR